MKKIVLILSSALLIVAIGILLIISCEKPDDSIFRIVKMTGGDMYINFSNFDQNPLGDSYEIENFRDSIHAKILMEGDILYHWSATSEKEYFYRYSFTEGDYLTFTEENSNLYVNGQLKSVFLDEESMDPDKLNALEDEIIKNLQSVVLPDSLSSQYIPGLERVLGLNPDIGLIIEGLLGNESMISMFNPSWIICDDLTFKTSGMDNVNQILVTEGSNRDFYELSSYPNLQQFIIWMDTVLELGNIPINSSLKSLTVFTSVENLSFVEKFPNLEVLNLSNDDQSVNIDAVAQLKNLRTFNLFNESGTTGLEALDNLNLLEWITLPSDISDENLVSFVEKHPEIRIFGVSNNTKVVDLEPLHSLKSLTCLSIYGDTLDIESLFGFKNLDYLGIPQEILYDSTNFDMLKAKFPETTVVANDIGICLGSGWLLLFIPVLVLVYLLFSYLRRKRNTL
jgi:hypothetical protein